jgi:hypothetical protein
LDLTINFENGHHGVWFDDANRASAPKSGHAHCHVRRKFSFLNLAVAQFEMSGRNPDRLLSYYLSLEVLPFGRRRLMLTTAQCQTYAAEYKSLARQTGVSEERTTLLKNIARSLKGVASQLDRLAVLLREEAK